MSDGNAIDPTVYREAHRVLVEALTALDAYTGSAQPIAWASVEPAIERIEHQIELMRASADVASVRTDIGKFLEGLGESVAQAQDRLDRRHNAAAKDEKDPDAVLTSYRIPRVEAELKFALEQRKGVELGVVFYKRSTEVRELHQQTIRCELAAVPSPPGFRERLRRDVLVDVEPPHEERRVERVPLRGLTKKKKAKTTKTTKVRKLPIRLLAGTPAFVFTAMSKRLEVELSIQTEDGSFTTDTLRDAASTRKNESVEHLAAYIGAMATDVTERGRPSGTLELDPKIRMELRETLAESSPAFAERFASAVVHRLGRSEAYLVFRARDRGRLEMGIAFVDLARGHTEIIRDLSAGNSRESVGRAAQTLFDVIDWQARFVLDSEPD